MPSPTDIRERALKKLGVTAVGQTSRAEFVKDIDQAYLEIYSMLESLNIVTWDFDDDVPNEIASPVVWLVADSRKDEYNLPDGKYSRITASAAQAVPKIREMLATDFYDVPEAEYF